MKLDIARAFFVVGALGVTSLAFAALKQPGTQVLMETGRYCHIPYIARAHVQSRPDHELLLFIFGMAQGVRASI